MPTGASGVSTCSLTVLSPAPPFPEQFRYKRRVYAQNLIDDKQFAKLHTKVRRRLWGRRGLQVSFLGQRPILVLVGRCEFPKSLRSSKFFKPGDPLCCLAYSAGHTSPSVLLLPSCWLVGTEQGWVQLPGCRCLGAGAGKVLWGTDRDGLNAVGVPEEERWKERIPALAVTWLCGHGVSILYREWEGLWFLLEQVEAESQRSCPQWGLSQS